MMPLHDCPLLPIPCGRLVVALITTLRCPVKLSAGCNTWPRRLTVLLWLQGGADGAGDDADSHRPAKKARQQAAPKKRGAGVAAAEASSGGSELSGDESDYSQGSAAGVVLDPNAETAWAVRAIACCGGSWEIVQGD